MQIKPLPQTPRRVDISEWNDETEAFLRPMNGFEALVFNDYFVKAITEKNDSYFTAFCYSAALPLFIHSSTSLGLYFQPRPTL